MSLSKPSNRVFLALVVVSMFTIALITGAFLTPRAEAAVCTNGQTRWVRVGCCACNYETNKKLQSCNGGVWVDTGYTQCFDTGTCCSFPCCF